MKRYHLIAYIRVDPEEADPLTYAQALAEKEQQEFLFPEHVFRIEEIPPVETPSLASLSHSDHSDGIRIHSDRISKEDPCIPPESRRS